VRNLLAVSNIDPQVHVLIVNNKGIKKHKFTLKDLQSNFPNTISLKCILQYVGQNSWVDMHNYDHKTFIPLHWVVGAILPAKLGEVL
jgi:hypothetical protein